jgi:hypothetical protein
VESEPRPAATQNQIEAARRQRTLDALYRCAARLAGTIGRDWHDCGKAACARSRRCRGFACEPDQETVTNARP